jgi:hypothetical protein
MFADLQHGEEGFHRHIDQADPFHAAFARFLFSSSVRLRVIWPP